MAKPPFHVELPPDIAALGPGIHETGWKATSPRYKELCRAAGSEEGYPRHVKACRYPMPKATYVTCNLCCAPAGHTGPHVCWTHPLVIVAANGSGFDGCVPLTIPKEVPCQT